MPPKAKGTSSGLKELSLSLSKAELVKRLKSLASHFAGIEQDDDKSSILPFIEQLVQPGFLGHRDKDVRLYVSCCLSDVFRVYAPESPYTNSQNKKVMKLIASQLQFLGKTTDPNHKQYYYVLENMADLQAFLICMDIDAWDVITDLFSMCFDTITSEHSMQIQSCFLTIMRDVVTNADFVSDEILDVIFHQLLATSKASKAANQLAKNLLKETAEAMQNHTGKFFDGMLGIGTSSNSELSEYAYELVSAISKIDSNILLKVLPLLEEQLGADDVDTRLQVVEVLAQIFEDQGYSLMEQHRKLWNRFVSRSIDQDASVRIQCAKHLATLGKAIAEVHADVWAKIRPMLLDEDPTVRAQACQTAFELAIVRPGMTAEASTAMVEACSRRADKKPAVRETVIRLSASAYDTVMSKYDQGQSAEDCPEVLRQLPLSVIARTTDDADRIVVAKAIHTSLLSSGLAPAEKALRATRMYAEMNPRYRTTFSRWIATQSRMNKMVVSAIAPDSKDDIEAVVKQVARWTGASDKVEQHLLALFQSADEGLTENLATAFSPGSSCEKAAAAQAQVLKLYEESTATKERTVVKEAISAVFARCAPFPVDAAAITALLQNLAQGAESEWADVVELEQSGIDFIVMYAPVCPERFVDTDLMGHLTDYIKSNQYVDSVMAIFLAIAKAELDASCDLTHLKKPLTKLATQGTPEQTQLAVRAVINIFGEDSATTKSVFKKLAAIVEAEADNALSALAGLEVFARELTDLFDSGTDFNITGHLANNVLLVGDEGAADEVDDGTAQWVEPATDACQTKVMAMKVLIAKLHGFAAVADLIEPDHLAANVTPIIQLLARCCDMYGELIAVDGSGVGTWACDRSRLRLTAATGLFEIINIPQFAELAGFEIFHIAATILQDSCEEVRTCLLDVVCRLADTNKISLKHVCALALCAADPSKEITSKAKTTLRKYIKSQRDKLRAAKKGGRGSAATAPPPEYALPYLLLLLAHHQDYNDDPKEYDDMFVSFGIAEQLQLVGAMKPYLDFFLDTACTKGAEGFGFLKALADSTRVLKDPITPEHSEPLHFVTEFAIVVILERARKPGWTLKKLPTRPDMPTDLATNGKVDQLRACIPIGHKFGNDEDEPGFDGATESQNQEMPSPMLSPVKSRKKKASAKKSAASKKVKKQKAALKTESAPTRQTASRSAKSANVSYEEDAASDVDDVEADNSSNDLDDMAEDGATRSVWRPNVSRIASEPTRSDTMSDDEIKPTEDEPMEMEEDEAVDANEPESDPESPKQLVVRKQRGRAKLKTPVKLQDRTNTEASASSDRSPSKSDKATAQKATPIAGARSATKSRKVARTKGSSARKPRRTLRS